MEKGYQDYTRPSGGYVILDGPPTSPGRPFSVPTANGSDASVRHMPGYSTVASSSFHAAGPNAYGNYAPIPGSAPTRPTGSMRGMRGTGHGRQHDDSWQAVVGPGGSGYGGMNANGPERHKAKAIARAQFRPPRAQSDSPTKKAAKERKAAQESASTADAIERQVAERRRQDDIKNRALAKAKVDKLALNANAEQDRAKNATDVLFEQKMARQQSTESGTSKAKRKDNQDASPKRHKEKETEKRKKSTDKVKGKARASDQESLECVSASLSRILSHPAHVLDLQSLLHSREQAAEKQETALVAVRGRSDQADEGARRSRRFRRQRRRRQTLDTSLLPSSIAKTEGQGQGQRTDAQQRRRVG